MNETIAKPFRLPWRKRVFKHRLFQNVSTWLIATLIKAMALTFRMDLRIAPESQVFTTSEDTAIFCFWHGRLILFPLFKPKKRQMHVLISHHRDGELITKVIRHFGIDSIRGSSSKGVKAATKNMIQILNSGHNISITPDGPRGPARKAAAGAAYLCRLSQRPMLPITYSAERCKRLSSWDRFMIPLPFSRVVVQIGAPIWPQDDSGKLSVEQLSQQLEDSLNHLTDEADTLMGVA